MRHLLRVSASIQSYFTSASVHTAFFLFWNHILRLIFGLVRRIHRHLSGLLHGFLGLLWNGVGLWSLLRHLNLLKVKVISKPVLFTLVLVCMGAMNDNVLPAMRLQTWPPEQHDRSLLAPWALLLLLLPSWLGSAVVVVVVEVVVVQ